MSFWNILENLFIGPLKIVFEIIYSFAYSFSKNSGISILFLSLIINILVFPLYRRADAMQESVRDVEAKLKNVSDHIKKTFTGDEKMMILQTYYRQNNYKPTDSLKGTVPLLLEIPFFMAAYQFLSNLSLLDGASLGPISNLASPDGLLIIGGFAINILPILMTIINCISSAIYAKGFPMKTKIQLYAMALVFLVLLYNSPSGLVFYWTLNNLFSLIKNLFYKLKNPKKVLAWICLGLGVVVVVTFALPVFSFGIKRKLLFIAVGLALCLPIVFMLIKKKVKFNFKKREYNPNKKLYISAILFMIFFIGGLIPATYIAAEPQEYIDLTYFYHPLWYIISSMTLAIGTFGVWMSVFYWLANNKGKVIIERLAVVLCGVFVINYMFFGTNLGFVSSNLHFLNGFDFEKVEILINIAVVIVAVVLLYLLACSKAKQFISILLIAATLVSGGMSIIKAVTISTSVSDIDTDESNSVPTYSLSKNGKNVVVIILDRAMGAYIPYIFNEKPELKEQFVGFTYYPNTISFGGCTKIGSPALYGGYEYTPLEINKRSDETLVDKHNEALKVLPSIFDNNGFNVTVFDPPLANYEWIADVSIYSDNTNINVKNIVGCFNNDSQFSQKEVNNRLRNFFCFSFMKSLPVATQPYIYRDGSYCDLNYASQVINNLHEASGSNKEFIDNFNNLVNLDKMTSISEDNSNNFIIMKNETTHNPVYLQTPEYLPSDTVDNTEYDAEHQDRFTLDGKTLNVTNENQMSAYHVNMASLIQIGNYLDYLRDNDLYDNTRIIISSDHGFDFDNFEELILDDGNGTTDVCSYLPLLMVKDFNSDELFTVSDEFMTNADVPTLATNDLIDNPINPYTNKPLNNGEKYAHDQVIMVSDEWQLNTDNKYTFLPSRWATVHDNPWDSDNWTFINEESIIPDIS